MCRGFDAALMACFAKPLWQSKWGEVWADLQHLQRAGLWWDLAFPGIGMAAWQRFRHSLWLDGNESTNFIKIPVKLMTLSILKPILEIFQTWRKPFLRSCNWCLQQNANHYQDSLSFPLWRVSLYCARSTATRALGVTRSRKVIFHGSGTSNQIRSLTKKHPSRPSRSGTGSCSFVNLLRSTSMSQELFSRVFQWA